MVTTESGRPSNRNHHLLGYMESVSLNTECLRGEVCQPPSVGTKIAKQQSLAFRPDIEGLRGIAVLLVVAFHTGIPGFSGGFVGVDVFFVLSGYLITGLLVAEIQKGSRLSLLHFYARRARRLLPACALTLSVTLLVGAVILAPRELTFAGRAARASALYMSNIFFAGNEVDYFSSRAETNPIVHTWSLGVEEQFYLFWPLLIMLGLQFGRSRKVLVGVLSGLTLLSLAVCVLFTANGGTFAFYGLPARVWEFGIGGLAALMLRGTLKLPAAGWFAVRWLGIVAILASGYLISRDTGFPGYTGLIPVMGTVTALVAGAELPHSGVGGLLGSAPLQILGTLSYSWYLWHWPFLVFSAAILPKIAIAGKITVAAASLVFAAITHRLIENPIRFHPYLVKRPALSLYLAAALTFCSLSAAFLCMRLGVRLANAPEMTAITAAIDDIGKLPLQQCASPLESSEVRSCLFGNTSSAINLVLFGDSHAMQWFNPLQHIAELHGWKLTTIVKPGCPATDISPPRISARFKANCATWRTEAIRQIVALRPSIVFLGNATIYLRRQDKPASRLDVSLDEWRDGTRRTLESLTGAGLQVVAMRDTPLPTFDIPTCLARTVRHSWYPGGSCEMDQSASVNPAVFQAEKASARGLPKVHFLDLTDKLCDGKDCWAVHQGMITYRDDNHLTGRFADSLTSVLEAGLLPILKIPS
jgi:peptidoglycan/LPS O-acetylase OafA/YrhL